MRWSLYHPQNNYLIRPPMNLENNTPGRSRSTPVSNGPSPVSNGLLPMKGNNPRFKEPLCPGCQRFEDCWSDHEPPRGNLVVRNKNFSKERLLAVTWGFFAPSQWFVEGFLVGITYWKWKKFILVVTGILGGGHIHLKAVFFWNTTESGLTIIPKTWTIRLFWKDSPT